MEGNTAVEDLGAVPLGTIRVPLQALHSCLEIKFEEVLDDY